MIHVSHQQDPFSPVRHSEVSWGVRCTARALAPEWAEPSAWVGCSRNGAAVTDWDALFADGDHVHYWSRPGDLGGVASLATILYGTTLASKLFGPKDKPADPGESPTNSFSGLKSNARGDGQAIPVLYGRRRVTPPIVNEYIRSSFDENGNPTSEYLALLLVSEGPIQSIGDKLADGGPFSREAGTLVQTLQINGQPAENFEGIEAHVRLGNLEQAAITEFADPVIERDIGLTLKDPASPNLSHATAATDIPDNTPGGALPDMSAIATAGMFAASAQNITKWNTSGSGSVGETSMVSYIGQDLADEFTLVLEFPNGLIRYDSLGNPLQHEIIYQTRYVQVDDGGTPFGNYIVLDARRVTMTRRGFVRIEDRKRTYNPSIYSAPSTGLMLESQATGTGNTGASYTIDTTKLTVPATNAIKFSFATWFRRRNVQANSTTNRLMQWIDLAQSQGFIAEIERDAFGVGLAKFRIGNGSSFTTLQMPGFGGYTVLCTDLTTWRHIAFTYEASYDGGSNQRVRFYLDGVLRGTSITSALAQWDTAQPIRMLSDSATSPALGLDGRIDETTFWSKALTAYEVGSLYNAGAPFAVDPTTPGLIVGAEWDTNAGTTPNIGSPAFGPAVLGANWIHGSGTNAAADPDLVTGAIVKAPLTTNVPLRSKWRVDVLRLDTEDTLSTNVSEVALHAIQWRTYQQFEYPGMALLAVKVLATDQISGGAPTLSVIAEGRLVPVWDGADLVSPNMPESYSRVPAWVAADIALNRDYGIGEMYRNVNIDVGQFGVLATLSSQRIYDNATRQLLVTARQIDAADTGTDANMAIVAEDCVRYRLDGLPANFPSSTAGKTSTGKFLTCKITGTPSPAVPAWLNTEIANGAQEVVYVAFDSASGDFHVYCKSSVPAATSALYTPSNTGTDFIETERHDVRFRCDAYFDGINLDAWEAVAQVLDTARAAPMRLGSRLSVFIDNTASPVALIGMGSIVAGSWQVEFQDIRARPNAESAEFFDEDRNFERDSQPDEHPDIVDPSKQAGFRWRRIRMEAITRRGAIKRYLRRDLNAYNLVRRFAEFELGIDGLAALAGDVIGISHDVSGYGFSGRVWEDATSGTSIKLDRVIVLAAATSYQIQVENVASEVRETKPITSVASTYQPGTAITIGGGGFSFSPGADDEYALGEVAKGEVKLFRIVETTLNPRTLRRRVKCMEYNAAVFSDDFGTLPEVQTTTLPAPSVPTVPAGVQNLTAHELTVKGPDGSVTIAAQVSFTHFPETYHSVGYTDVYVSRGTSFADARLVTTLAPADVYVEIGGHHFARDVTHRIWVVPRTRDGATAYRSWASFVEFTPTGLAAPPLKPGNVRAAISGEQVLYLWDDPGDGDQSAVVEARQGGWIMGLPLFIAPAQARSSPPLPVWNSAPASALAIAETPIYFRTKLGTGQFSDIARLDFTPSVPSADGTVLQVSEEDIGWP